MYDEEDLYDKGHKDGWEKCREFVILCLDKNKSLTVEEIKNKILSKEFEYGEF